VSNSITIFISGITGVFCGMSLLYISIKITALVVDALEPKEEAK
jgi:hypothetical protein